MSVCVEVEKWLCGVCVYTWGHCVFRERWKYRCGGRDVVWDGVCVERWTCVCFKVRSGVFVWKERLLCLSVCTGRHGCVGWERQGEWWGRDSYVCAEGEMSLCV